MIEYMGVSSQSGMTKIQLWGFYLTALGKRTAEKIDGIALKIIQKNLNDATFGGFSEEHEEETLFLFV